MEKKTGNIDTVLQLAGLTRNEAAAIVYERSKNREAAMRKRARVSGCLSLRQSVRLAITSGVPVEFVADPAKWSASCSGPAKRVTTRFTSGTYVGSYVHETGMAHILDTASDFVFGFEASKMTIPEVVSIFSEKISENEKKKAVN